MNNKDHYINTHDKMVCTSILSVMLNFYTPNKLSALE